MQTSVIRHRVADFLRRYPPFDALPEQDLLEVAGSGRVKFHESEEYIARQGDAWASMVWIIQQGRVEVLEDEQLRDVLGEGDMLGLECFVGDRRCLHSARTASDVILYGIRVAHFESLIARHPAVKRFLVAHFSVGADLGVGRSSWLDAEPPPLDFLRARLAVLPIDASVAHAAFRLTAANSGVLALIDGSGRPAALVTASELCATPAALARDTAQPCPPTVTAPLTTRAAVGAMLQSRREAIAITADGTRESRLEAILTASDLALFCGHNPAAIVGAIRRAHGVAEIAPLLRQARSMVIDALARPQDVDDCCRMETEVVAALAEACLRLARGSVLDAGIDPPRVPCCWLSFGGFARGDRLEPGLPTIAVVYDDAAEHLRPDDSSYFAAVAGEAMAWFHACGLVSTGWRWPEGAEPFMPLSEWTRLYSETIRNPVANGLHARREFFDLRLLGGDEDILRRVQNRILLELRDHETAIPLLANDTLAHLPPLTFFRGLVLELDGEQRDSFDIGRTALSPIADAARVFALAGRRLSPVNTLDRLELAALDFPEAAEIFREAADAFRVALYYQAVAGNLVEPGRVGKLDQRLLKTALLSIHRLHDYTAGRFIPNA